VSDEDRIFGPDRDEAPGVTPQPGRLPAQFVEFMVESAAMHSKSRGWLPAVVVRSATDDGAGLVGSMEVDDRYWEWVESLITAGERAVEDVAAVLRDGPR
jgi:hypothetical protein